jgi:2-iminobutanoate/2-iminopropanoate deaminase
MQRLVIQTPQAPKAIGPYSQGILAEGRLVFVSGQVGFEPQTGQLAEGIEAQTEQALRNITAILEAGGTDLAHVVKVTVLLKSISDFATVNTIYARHFSENQPARATFGGLELPAGALVEIECVALLPD